MAGGASDMGAGTLGTVLVLDGNQRSALAVTRSLGRHGVSVIVADETQSTLAGSSRFCCARAVYPSPYHSAVPFLDAVRREVLQRRVDVVLPMTEVTTELLLEHRATLPSAVVPSGTIEAFRMLTDKWRLYLLAQEAGVRTPLTRWVHGRGELEAALEGARFPVVLKPYRSRVPDGAGWHAPAVRYAWTAEEALRIWADDAVFQRHGVLVQEFVSGEGRGLSCLYDSGRCVAIFGHRRLREKPPSGGVSVVSESVPVDPSMAAMATAVLDRAGWHGVAMVEFKVARDGRPYLIEVNARFWGSLQLAVDAGLDFPWLLYRLATGRTATQGGSYHLGVRNRWLLGDMDHLLLALRESRGIRSRLRTVGHFLRPTGLTRHEINRLDDLRPAMFEFVKYTRALFG